MDHSSTKKPESLPTPDNSIDASKTIGSSTSVPSPKPDSVSSPKSDSVPTEPIDTFNYHNATWTAIIKIRDGQYNDEHAFILNMRYGTIDYGEKLTKLTFSSANFVPPFVPYMQYMRQSQNLSKKKIPNYAILREYDTFSY